MIMELMDSDLHKVIQSNKSMTVRHHKCFIKQILEGIKAMHSIGVFHRDLKPGNILVSKDCQVRITDFGLARFMDDSTKRGENELNPMTEYVVTRWYRPPELLLAPTLPYKETVDLWSIGCILAELVNRKALFPGKDHLHQVQLIFEVFGYEGRGEEELGFPVSTESARVLERYTSYSKQPLSRYMKDDEASMLSLLESLMTVNPNERPTAEQALAHPWLADAEVLHDYSRPYLTKPAPDFFAFEHTPFTVPELRAMIVHEVSLIAADAYLINQSPNPSENGSATTSPRGDKDTATTTTTTHGVGGGSTGGRSGGTSETSTGTAGAGARRPKSNKEAIEETVAALNKQDRHQPMRRRSDPELVPASEGAGAGAGGAKAALGAGEEDEEADGPASQLPTAKARHPGGPNPFANNNSNSGNSTTTSTTAAAPTAAASARDRDPSSSNPFRNTTGAAAASQPVAAVDSSEIKLDDKAAGAAGAAAGGSTAATTAANSATGPAVVPAAGKETKGCCAQN
jgi:serine/threonine protein kinase